jgi:hypothetical protein
MFNKKIAVTLGGLAIAGLVAMGQAGLASAEMGTDENPTLNDAQGFAVTNHMKGDGEDGHSPLTGYNGDHHGIGWIRSGQTGEEVSSAAGVNRVSDDETGDPNSVNYQDPDMTKGNKVTPKK